MESGDLAYPNTGTTATGQLEVVVDSLKAMGYAAVGVGPVDVRFGDNYYRILRQKGMPVVNIGVPDSTGAKPFVIRKLGSVKVGIVSFGIMPDGASEDLTVLKQRYQAYGEARQKSDVLIVLDQGNIASPQWLERISKRYGAPDIVLAGTKNMVLVEPQMVGDTMIVPTSVQGNSVGRVDIEINGTSKKKTYKRVAIEEKLPDDPAVLKIIKDYQAPKITSILSGPSSMQGPAPAGSYFSYQGCIACHENEYEQWKTTKHAIALTTLEKKNSTLVECLPCHSEMYRRVKRTATGADGLGGVECMTCHADVVPHGADYKAKHNTAAIQVVCKNCHTKERSPNFSPTAYYDLIKHEKS